MLDYYHRQAQDWTGRWQGRGDPLDKSWSRFNDAFKHFYPSKTLPPPRVTIFAWTAAIQGSIMWTMCYSTGPVSEREREKRQRERDGAWSITGQRVADALRRRQGEYLLYLGLGYIRDVYTHSCECACVRVSVCVCVCTYFIRAKVRATKATKPLNHSRRHFGCANGACEPGNSCWPGRQHLPGLVKRVCVRRKKDGGVRRGQAGMTSSPGTKRAARSRNRGRGRVAGVKVRDQLNSILAHRKFIV